MNEDLQRALVAQREREAIAIEMKALKDDAERYRFQRSMNAEDLKKLFDINMACARADYVWTKAKWDEELDKARGVL